MPNTLHARLTKLGWDHDLVVETREGPPPEPGSGQVCVKVEACGVCYRDCIDRDGRFKFIQLPVTPGHEAVGRVSAVGPDVHDWAVGDRVGSMHRDHCGQCAACRVGDTSACMQGFAVPGLLIDGGYASHLLAPQSGLFRVPEEMPAAHAAVMHCTYGTAYRGLMHAAKLREGERVLVTGANGGVGVAAIQVATRLGAHVIAVVRDDKHRDMLLQLGASDVVVNDGSSFHKQLPGEPADVALDCVGPPTFNSALRSLRSGGRVVVIGNVVQEKVALNLGYIVTRGIAIFGSHGATREDMAKLFAIAAEEPFDVQIEQELELAQADEAQRRVRAGGLCGRLVLRPSSREIG